MLWRIAASFWLLAVNIPAIRSTEEAYNEMWPWDESTVIPTTNSGHTGDGHVLAEGLGAELKNMGRQMVFPIADSIDYSTETIVGNAGLGSSST